MKKAPGIKPGSLVLSLKSDKASSKATEQDLVVDSGSTDHIVVNKNWFICIREIDTTVTNPDGGNTKVLGIGEAEVLARDVKGCTKPFILKKALYVPWYRTNLVSVSSIINNGHKVVNEKKNSYLCRKSKEKFLIIRKVKLSFCPRPQKKNSTLLTWVGVQMKPSSGTNAWASWTPETWKTHCSWIWSSMMKNVNFFVSPFWFVSQPKLPFQNKLKTKHQKQEKEFLLMLLVQWCHQALMGFVISSLCLTTIVRMHVSISCATRIKRCQNSRSTLLKMVLLAYYGLTMAPSIRITVSNSFVPTTKSNEIKLFLKLRNRMVSQSDTTEQLLKLLEVFWKSQNCQSPIGYEL